ncbi:hypothetical protein D8M30_06135 [Corynebacterium pseudodiphtheriticum]|nr:hypothetical protein D8M30_06135 [Corynebacterium pseudodiphtheriticum]
MKSPMIFVMGGTKRPHFQVSIYYEPMSSWILARLIKPESYLSAESFGGFRKDCRDSDSEYVLPRTGKKQIRLT